MTLWHTSTELQATADAAAAKATYLAAGWEAGYALGLGRDTATYLEVEVEAALSGLSDTSG
ncbi:hypothetical protein R5W24_005150 [Gemmata sp. JC717]|uniref:hypothetical protein n=1 Tax=Gemmata algarum TaxID=2975278 RepID=UPI0021BB05A3|nr:hypothetical protein [Gemmata algarum]MDY3556002.1 hypothetical protein [Gemmata algarum]